MVYSGFDPKTGEYNTQAPYVGLPALFVGGGEELIKRLEQEYKQQFPSELKEYLANYAPENCIETFWGLNGGLVLTGANQFSYTNSGYNWNYLYNEIIEEWAANWFLIGQDDGDPYIVDLNHFDVVCPVLTAYHGEGSWNFRLFANSIADFLAGEWVME